MRRLLVPVVLVLCAWPAVTQELSISLRDIPALVAAKDLGISTATQSALLAYSSYRSSFAQSLPQIDFTPSYGLQYTPTTTVPQFSIITTPPFFVAQNQTNNEYGIHDLGMGLSLSQILPTAGTISVALKNDTNVWSYGSQTVAGTQGTTYPETQFAQKPKVSFTLNQPILFNGKLIDMGLFPATLREAQLGYLMADQDKRFQTNQAIYQAIQSYLLIVQLRKNIAQVEKAIDVSQGNLESLQKNFSLGAATEADVLDARIAVSNQNGALLDLRSNLLKAHRALAHSIGRDSLDGVSLSEEIPDVTFTVPREDAISRAQTSHPLIQKTSLAAEQKRVEDVISGQSHASNFSLSLSYSPRYPSTGSITSTYMTTFNNSFSDLYGSSAGTDWALSAGLTLHLYDGGKAAADHAAKEAAVRMAQDNLATEKRSITDQVEMDLLQKANLDEKIPMLETAVDLAGKRRDTEKRMLELGKSTELSVASRNADYDLKVNDLWRARVDRLLTLLDLHALVGDDLTKSIEGTVK